MSPPPDVPLPLGTRVELDADTVLHENGSIVGGSPGRIFRLNDAARRAFSELLSGEIGTRPAAVLGRRLVDAGALHPRPGRAPGYPGQVTVVIPVRDRHEELAACLGHLNGGGEAVRRVLVVDDGSADPDELARVVEKHGADLVRRDVNGGPAAARNTGLRHVDTPFVAFLDSDCRPGPAWVDELVGHFDDPVVAAVAPRITAAGEGGGSRSARFAHARPVLDLGDRPARVAPMTRVSYVPTAALLLRRTALEDLDAPGFDAGLRYGEDVDLVWRLLDAGWRIRYDPGVAVEHTEPTGWKALLERRFAYGHLGRLLEDRHPGRVAPLVLVAGPAVTVAGILTRRPLLVAAGFAAGYLDAARTLRRAELPVTDIARPLYQGTVETFFGSSRWFSQFAAPALLLAAGPRRGRAVRVAVLTGWLTAGSAREWLRTRPPISAPEWAAGVLADDLAYGAGVWRGSLRRGHLRAVLPRWRWHLVSPPQRTRV